MTSSGRRCKRRKQGDHDGNTSRSKRPRKKSRNGRKTTKRKSFTGMSLRPQRVAARSATNVLSQISEGSTAGEDEDDSEDDSSESGSLLQDSNIQDDETDENLQTVHRNYPKVEQRPLDLSEDAIKPLDQVETQINVENRKRLVLKISLRDHKKSVPSEINTAQSNNQNGLASSFSKTNEETYADLIDSELSEKHNSKNFRDNEERQIAEDRIETSTGYNNAKTGWGEVRTRTSKRMKAEDLIPMDSCVGYHETHGGQFRGKRDADNETILFNECEGSSGVKINGCFKDCSESDLSRGYELGVGTSHSPELKENPTPKPIKLRIKSKNSMRLSTAGAGGDLISGSPSCMEQNLILGVPDGPSSVQRFHSDMDIKRDGVIPRINLKGYNGDMGESTSKVGGNNHGPGIEIHEAAIDVMPRTRSLRLKASLRETNAVNHNIMAREGYQSVGASENAEKYSRNTFDRPSSDEWVSNSKMTRFRPTRNKKDNYYNNNQSSSAGRKSHNTQRKSNWLLLSEQEDGYRYIPQLGDEVMYLRQVSSVIFFSNKILFNS